MSNGPSTISSLPATTGLIAGELFPVVQGGVTKQVTMEQLAASPQIAAVLQAALLIELPKWQPNTAYLQSVLVVNPSGQVVQANAAFTSGAAYNPANWTVLSLTIATVASMIATQAAADALAYLAVAGGSLTGSVISQDGSRLASMNDLLVYAVALGA